MIKERSLLFSLIVATMFWLHSISLAFNFKYTHFTIEFMDQFLNGYLPFYVILVALFPAFLMFKMLRTGEIYRWRKIFFLSLALLLLFDFLYSYSGIWGSPSSVSLGNWGEAFKPNNTNIIIPGPSNIQKCAMGVSQLLFFLPSKLNFPYVTSTALKTMFALFIIGLLFGRSYCSWVCPFGGQDEFFSSIKKKKIFNLSKFGNFFYYFSIAFLLFLLLYNFVFESVLYCERFCPFSTMSGIYYKNVNSIARIVQIVTVVIIWFALVVILPFLSKKRMFCSTLCPAGVIFSLLNKISLFKIKINSTLCNKCFKCIDSCPTFALTKNSISDGEILSNCMICGACSDQCPKKAIEYKLGVGNYFQKFFRKFDIGLIFVFSIFSIGSSAFSMLFIEVLIYTTKFFE